MLIGRGLEARLWAVLNKTRKQTGYALIGELNPGCRWCIDDDGEQVGDVGSPFLRLMQYSLWTLKKLRLAHISVKKNISYIYDFINDNDENRRSEVGGTGRDQTGKRWW